MRSLYAFVALALFAFDSPGQWAWSANQSTGAFRTRGAYFSTSNTGLIAVDQQLASGGRVRRTTDGGSTWTITLNAGSMIAGHMAFANANVGVVSFADLMSGERAIYHTTNGGTTWSIVDEDFYPIRIQFIDDNTGFAIGTNPLSLGKTVDGGLTWTTENITAPAGTGMGMITSLHFTSPMDGFIVGGSLVTGSNGEIWRTTDGGTTWSIVPLPAGQRVFDDVVFTSPNVGYVAGFDITADTGLILHTTDGGTTWSIGPVSNTRITCIRYVNPYQGYATNTAGQIWKTSDAGQSWTLDFTGIPGGNMLTVLALADNAGYAFGLMQLYVKHSTIVNVEEFDAPDAFAVGPNPVSNGELYIHATSTTVKGKELEARLMNSLGAEVMSARWKADHDTHRIALPANLTSGAYLLRISALDMPPRMVRVIVP